jgi:hypothetical protein
MACKEDILKPELDVPIPPNIAQVDSRNGGDLVVLGAQKSIPYKVEVIRQAYNNLYEPDLPALLPNHVYVRFLPQSPQDYKKMYESGLEFWDFPLDREILQMGDHYQDPTAANSSYSWRYTVAPLTKPLPDVQHEVLEQLAMVPEDCLIAKEAFAITGNDYHDPDVFVPDPGLGGGTFNFLIAPGNDDGDPDGSSGSGNSNSTREACDCDLPDHSSKPSGCVTVEDNMLDIFEGVKELKVITSKSHFWGFLFNRSTHTDYAGCWMIDHKYQSGVHIWVKWENDRCDVKVMDAFDDIEGFILPRKAYIGYRSGSNHNNIAIVFNHTSAIASWDFRNWAASSANNSVYEFGGYTFNQGILSNMPDNLKILITPWGNGNSGAAPMLDKLGFLHQLWVYLPVNIIVGFFNVATPGSLVLLPLVAWLEASAPDIVFNLTNPGNVNSDDLRELAYHELAHAIHFSKVGSNYWTQEIFYTIEQLGYGDGNEDGAGRCSVIESWGYLMGMSLAHERYGINNSNPGSAPDLNTWRSRLEADYCFENNPLVHIPYGWEWDIQDHNPANPFNEVESGSVMHDNVNGFTNAQIFNKMNSSVISMPKLKNALIEFLPPSVNIGNYNALAADYLIQ